MGGRSIPELMVYQYRNTQLIFSILFGFMILVGCSNGQYAGTGNSSNPQADQKKGAPKLEIVQQTGKAWRDSIGTVWVHSAAVFQNTGTVPVKIKETQMNFKGQDGGILGTGKMIYAVPDIVLPGDKAYITESTILKGISDASQYKETSFNFGFDQTDKNPNLLEISGIKGMKGDSFSPYKVTGLVKNTTASKQDDIRIAAALFDEQGVLLGVLKGSINVGLNPGSEAGFELTYPQIPSEVAGKVSKVDVKAFGWNW